MTYNSTIITRSREFRASLRGSFTILCPDNRFIVEPVWRLLRLARTKREETAFDAVEFIEFPRTETGSYIYRKSKDGCAWTLGTGSRGRRWGLWLPTDTRQRGCADRSRQPRESLITLVICWWLLSRRHGLTWRRPHDDWFIRSVIRTRISSVSFLRLSRKDQYLYGGGGRWWNPEDKESLCPLRSLFVLMSLVRCNQKTNTCPHRVRRPPRKGRYLLKMWSLKGLELSTHNWH